MKKMTNSAAAEKHSLTVRRAFNAPRERVFAAWTDPKAIALWHAAAEYAIRIPEFDLREGGAYRYEFTHVESGNVTPVWGVFREVRSPERLVYTWNHAGPKFTFSDSVVTVEFHAKDGGTEIVINHELFPTAEIRDAHQSGWTGCFDRLPKTL